MGIWNKGMDRRKEKKKGIAGIGLALFMESSLSEKSNDLGGPMFCGGFYDSQGRRVRIL